MIRVAVGFGTCGLAAGAGRVYEAAAKALDDLRIDARLHKTGCLGPCWREPLLGIGDQVYGDVMPEEVPALLRAHLLEGRILTDRLVTAGHGEDCIVLSRCGRVDPESLDDYLSYGGFRAHLGSPEEVIAQITASGLRGRGGAGFPTGKKWTLARAQAGADKVVVCNADEGDPGAFMDRNVLEGDPFAVIEGLLIAAFAVGATEAYVYVREEYPLAGQRIEGALAQLRARGLLTVPVHVRRGSGAFVCGEETALIASLEGRRPTPRTRPPFPVERGLFGRPTAINNVETLAAVPWILTHGATAFARHGHGTSRGTKVFSLTGDVRRPGMVEVPMGRTLREIVVGLGGGGERRLKAVQIGGPSGGCLPASLFDTPIDYESLQRTGVIMGSGGLIALDESRCMVDLARYFVAFSTRESCGKCTFCRIGTRRMLDLLDRICGGEGRAGDLELLQALAEQVGPGSLCGLGRSAPNPVLTTLRYFKDEYEAHLQGRCPAGRCKGLVRYRIDPFVCDGCTTCFDQCAAEAIRKGVRAIGLAIDPEQCLRCGGCLDVCQFGAVTVS